MIRKNDNEYKNNNKKEWTIMNELEKLETEKLVDEIEEIKQRIKNELLTEKLLMMKIQNMGLETGRLEMEIKKIEVDIRVADRKFRAYDEMESFYIEMKGVAKHKKEVWFARAQKEGIKY